MRRRLYRVFEDSELVRHITRAKLEKRLGCKVPMYRGYTNWSAFFEQCSISDLLDSITAIADFGLKENTAYRSASKRWIDDVRVVFREENVRYRLDDAGVAHFAVDGEYEHSVACTLAALDLPRYSAARGEFEAAQRALDTVPMQSRDAIRYTFQCAETIFKLMFAKESALGATEVDKKLRPLVEARPNGSERNAELRLIDAFKQWIVSCHQYRHAQGVEVPDNPDLRLTLLSVSSGAAFIRWLAEFDSGRV